MDFITVPLVVGIIFYFTYLVFELFARRKERMYLIEKMADKADPSLLNAESLKNRMPVSLKSFTSLKLGCLLTGLGIGLFVGLIINLIIASSRNDLGIGSDGISYYTFSSIAYGASILIFGGLGLLIAYSIESKAIKKEKN